MLRNYFAAALRNMARNRVHTAITLIGLSIGFAAAVLIGAFVRQELTYDRWVPNHEQIYRLSAFYVSPGRSGDMVLARIASWLKTEMPQLEAVGRLAPPPYGVPAMPVKRGEIDTLEKDFYWADASFFDVVRLPVLAGDPSAALKRPDGLVLTRAAARRYFGIDAPLGETLLLDGQHLMTVGAVIEDLPGNSHFALQVLASGSAPFSELSKSDADPNPRTGNAYTYARLAPSASFEKFTALLPEVIDRNSPPLGDGRPASAEYKVRLVPLTAIHFSADAVFPMKPRGDSKLVAGMSFTGLLILIVTGVNFIGLATARAEARAQEVGVRKSCGAARHDIALQFLGETALFVFVGCLLALGLSRILGPYLGEPQMSSPFGLGTARTVVEGMGTAVLVAVLAASYPAFVLSAFRPANAVSNTLRRGRTATWVRSTLVALQFGVLTALVVATITMHRQMAFATSRVLTFDTSQVLLVDTACTGSFPAEVRRLPGVEDARCSGSMLAGQDLALAVARPDGTRTAFALNNAAPGLLDLFGIRPTAGRLLAANDSDTIVLNQAAVHALGFARDEDVLGLKAAGAQWGTVVGVVPDVVTRSIREAVRPTVYSLGGRQKTPFSVLNIKLRGDRVQDTLNAIDDLWRKTGDRPGPASRRFYDEYIQSLYVNTTRQTDLFTATSLAAIFVAALGLFGLSAFTAERRTKEIGIRKAMGATRAEVLKILLWQFARPVLLANAVAWPAAYLTMRRWLDGFAYRIDLEPWMFLTASVFALTIALATVIGHALLVARARPVAALRYE